MNILGNLRIRGKLLLMLSLPVLALLYMSVAELSSKWSLSSEMDDLRSMASVAVSASALVHELQKERGATAGFLGSKGDKFGKELSSQRRETDSRVASLEETLNNFNAEILPTEARGQLTSAQNALGKISNIRSRANQLSIATKDAIGFYTGINSDFLNMIGGMVAKTTEADFSRQLSAYANYLQGKERAGIERAVMSNTFAAGRFGEGMFSKFITLVAQQESYGNVFKGLATEEHQNFYSTTMRGKNIDEVARMRQIAMDKADVGDFGVEATYWFQTITGKINQLKEVEDYLAAELDTEAEHLSSSSKTAFWITAVLVGCVLMVTILLGAVIARAIYVPLNRVVALTEQMNTEFAGFESVVEAIAHNDLTQELKQTKIERIGIDTKDEIGELVSSVEATLEAKARMGDSLTGMLENLNIMVSGLSDNARELSSAATEISSSADQASQGAQRQADQIEQMSTAVEQMSVTIIESSKNAVDASEASQSASDTAGTGGKIVNDTRNGMKRIAEVVTESAESIGKLETSAQQIGEIVDVIDDIADQTNLLALNAAIEAARAGEQGRGFAVVADEVRKLAELTGRATGEITAMIKGIQGQTKDAVVSMNTGVTEVEAGRELAEKAGVSLDEIVSVSGRVVDMIQQIATATEEQSVAAEQITKNIEGISSIAGETAKGAEQSAAAADELSRQADSLQQVVSQFKVVGTSEN